jgi:hypothetical protein
MKLLDEFKGKKVTAKAVNGYITFDTNTTPESEYSTYYSLGFDFCFEVIEPKYKKPISYVGIEQEIKTTKVNQKKNGKKVKTETEKE